MYFLNLFSEIWDLGQFLWKKVNGPSFHVDHGIFPWFHYEEATLFGRQTLMKEDNISYWYNGKSE